MGMIKRLITVIPIIIFFKFIGMETYQSIVFGGLLTLIFRDPPSFQIIKIISYTLAIIEICIYYQTGIIQSLSLVNNLIKGIIGAFI
jgi:hypothetical protein